MQNFGINEMPQAAKKIADDIRKRISVSPRVGVILGSGWGGIASALDTPCRVPYSELDGMPACGVAGHAGNFVFGKIGNIGVAAVQGRFHLYEGKSEAHAVLPLRILFELGARTVILTNAAGGLNPNFSIGDLMILDDHINFTCRNPLIGLQPTPEFPERFVDMTEVYDKSLREIIFEECGKLSVPAHFGTYMQVLGPSYETPAEIRAFRTLGADAVGMSTVVEAIYARYLGMKVAAISNITNLAAGLSAEKLAHADVLQESNRREPALTKLMRAILARAQ